MFTTEFHSSANSPNIIAFTKLYCGVTVLERVSQNTTISEIAKVVLLHLMPAVHSRQPYTGTRLCAFSKAGLPSTGYKIHNVTLHIQHNLVSSSTSGPRTTNTVFDGQKDGETVTMGNYRLISRKNTTVVWTRKIGTHVRARTSPAKTRSALKHMGIVEK